MKNLGKIFTSKITKKIVAATLTLGLICSDIVPNRIGFVESENLYAENESQTINDSTADNTSTGASEADSNTNDNSSESNNTSNAAENDNTTADTTNNTNNANTINSTDNTANKVQFNDTRVYAKNNNASVYAAINSEILDIPKLRTGEKTREKVTINGKSYYAFSVTKSDDVLALQQVSANDSLEDCAFTFTDSGQGSQWNLSAISGFTGISPNKEYPFKGIIGANISRGVNYTINRPLFVYISTDATIQNISLLGVSNNNTSVAAIGVTLLKGVAKNITIKNVTIRGAFVSSTAGSSVGALFANVINETEDEMKLDTDEWTNLSLALNGNAKVSISSVRESAGGLIGVISGKVVLKVGSKISFDNAAITGNATYSRVGTIVGSIINGATLEIAASKTFNKVGNGINGLYTGGLVGYVENSKVLVDENAEITITTTNGNYSIGNTAAKVTGGIAGYCVNSQVIIRNVTFKQVFVSASTNASVYGTSGLIVGKLSDCYDSEISNINITSASAGAVYVNGYVVGGIAGEITGKNITIKDIVLAGNNYYGGADNYTNGATGGVVGRIAGQNIEIDNVSVQIKTPASNNYTNLRGYVRGGIVGAVICVNNEYNSIKIKDITITGLSNGTGGLPNTTNITQGGVIGRVDEKSLVCFDGTIDLSKITAIGNANTYNYAKYGILVGYQDGALLYREKESEILHTDISAMVGTKNIVGTYGGIYVNRYLDSSNTNKLIEFETEEENIKNAVKGQTAKNQSGAYLLAGNLDFYRLSITQFSNGNFALNCFGEGTADKLLSADYEITADNIDLRDTGIYSLTKTGTDTSSATVQNSFSGSFTGVAGKTTITLDNITTTQFNLGLFSSVQNAAFKNLNIITDEAGGYVYPRNFGALAAIGFNSLTVQNVSVGTTVKVYAFDVSKEYYYGGAIGYINSSKNKLIVSDFETACKVNNITKVSAAGGFAGYILHSTSKKTDTDTDIIFKNVKISFMGSVIASYYSVNGSGNTIGKIGGLVGILNNPGANPVNETYTTIAMQNITIEDTTIDMSLATANNERAYSSGSLIGGKWNNVETTISENAVDNTNTTDNSINIKSANLYGRGGIGVVYGVYVGKLRIDNFKAGEGTINIKSLTANRDKAGFLVYDGRYAYMVLNGYDINSANITYTGSSYIDDICSYVLNDANSNANGNSGGIINIKDEQFAMGQSEGYINKISPQTGSNNTRYYYNVLELSDAYGKDMLGNVIDSPEKLMVYHLYLYANSQIRRFVSEYILNDAINYNTKIEGTINLTGYSYYPTIVPNSVRLTIEGENAVIVFPNEDTLSLFTTNKIETNNRRHYKLYGGLLCTSASTTSVVNISNITFTGAIGKNIVNGFLYNGVIYGTHNVNNITLDNARVYNYNGEHKMGLLISAVGNGTVLNITGVETASYSGTQRNKKVAAALIGTVGSNTADNIRVVFRNINIDFMVNNNSTNKVNNKISPFRYATLICTYDYVRDAGKNKGYGVYYFSSEDYDNNVVTLGRELASGAELEDDLDILTNAMAYANFNDDITAISTTPSAYLPYVCEQNTVSIFVNPKSGNITKGCGTYEDPYIIENEKQIYSLYMYLSGNSSYDGVLSDWYVNKMGNSNTGESFCDKTTHDSYRYGDNDENFPSRNAMAGAYYIIANDIDMSKITDVNIEKLAYDYTGLGNSTYPFTGVMVGRKADGTAPTIILPASNIIGNAHRTKENFGFIQYLRGGVVKDIIFETEKYADGNKNELYVSGVNGFVAAIVEGGDNIIENVTIKGSMHIDNNTAYAAGYVGKIIKGGVILRDVDKNNLSEFKVEITGVNNVSTSRFNYITSKVEDGYLLFETVNKTVISTSKKIITATDLGFTVNDYKLSATFEPVNADYLKQDTTKIKLSIDNSTKKINILLDSDKDLEIIALALNSDSLSFMGNNKLSTTNGYNEKSINRKAYYNNLGTDDTTNSDLVLARTYDNNHYEYPYLLYTYFEPETTFDDYYDTYLVDGKSYKVSRFNKTVRLEKLSGIDDYTANYEIEAGKTLDMTAYKYSFRGIGALYNMSYSRFNGSFNGNGSKIIVDMSLDFDLTLNKLGLFNELNTTGFIDGLTEKNTVDANAPIIENLVVSGDITNNSVVNAADTNANATSYVNNTRAGGVAAGVSGSYNFSDIALEDLNVTAYGDAGGITGRVVNMGNTVYYPITIDNCSAANTVVKSLGIQSDTYRNYDAGGFIGKVGAMYTVNDNYRNRAGFIYRGTINITNPNTNGLTVESYQGSCGGLIGSAEYLYDTTINVTKSDSGVAVLEGLQLNIENNTKNYNSSAGGVIGNYTPTRYQQANSTGNTLLVDGIEVKNSSIEASKMTTSSNTGWMAGVYGLGGIIGVANSRNNENLQTTVNINNCKITNLSIADSSTSTNTGATGGIAGALGAVYSNLNNTYTAYSVMNYLSVTNISVDGLDIQVEKDWANGGIVGQLNGMNDTRYTMDFEDITVNNAAINCKDVNAGTVSGVIGVINAMTRVVLLKNIIVEGSEFNTLSNTTDTDNYNMRNGVAGGVVGAISANNSSNINGYNITSKGNKFSAYFSGGVLGVVNSNSIKLNMGKLDIENNTISGIISGGFIGRNVNIGNTINSFVNDVLVKGNTITAFGNTTYKGIAGGLIGKANLNSNSGIMNYSNISIEGNVIAVAALEKCKAGGVIGSVMQGVNNFYSVTLKNNRIGYMEEITTYDKNIYDALAGVDFEASVKLRNTIKKSFEIPEESLSNQADIHKYSFGVGNFVGEIANVNAGIKFLGVEVSYDDDYTGTRPLIDVGIISAYTSLNSVSRPNINEPYAITRFTNPWDYRNSVRIIYTNDLNNKDLSLVDYTYGPSTLEEMNNSNMLFSTLGDRITKYDTLLNSEGAGTLTTKQVLNTYRLNIAYDNVANTKYGTVKQIMDISYLTLEDAAPNLTGATVPVIVADGQYSSAYDIVNATIDTLTNGGGTVKINSNNSGYSIEARKAIVTKNAAGQYELSYQSGTPSVKVTNISNIAYNGFDTYGTDSNGKEYATITILKVTYGYNAGRNDYTYDVTPDITDSSTTVTINTKKVLYIPVFVKERLEVNVSFKLKEGAVYNASDISNTGYVGQVIMAKDTTYSILSHFQYGSSVENTNYSNLSVNKVLKLTDVNGNMMFDIGTKLTLVDINTGHAYYYEITGENAAASANGIPYTSFLDENGVAYTNKTMQWFNDNNLVKHNASGEAYAIDDAIIVVQLPKEVEAENAVYNINISTNGTEHTSQMQITNEQTVEVTSIPGLVINFDNKIWTADAEGDSDRTYISGDLTNKKKDSIVIYARTAIVAARDSQSGIASYWDYVNGNRNVIDSSNNGKYLEIALYLQEQNASKRMSLPVGTIVTVYDDEYPEGRKIELSYGQSVIYYYKDSERSYGLNNIVSDTYKQHKIVLDFSNTDLRDYTSSNYEIYMELIRSGNPNYPMSSDRQDDYSKTVATATTRELAIATQVKELISLGINIYKQAATLYEIPFESKIDFGDVIDFTNDSESSIDNSVYRYSQKNYYISYKIYKKNQVAGQLVYEPIDNSFIKLYYKDGDEYREYHTNGKVGEDFKYEDTYKFSEEEIKNGTNGTNGLITRDMKLVVDTQMDDIYQYLTNYKIEMRLVPYDDGVTEINDDITSLKDYFIFTIAKLKTDL